MLKALLKTAPPVGFASPNFAVALTPYPFSAPHPAAALTALSPWHRLAILQHKFNASK